MSVQSAAGEVEVAPERRKKRKTEEHNRPKRQPPYAVVLHNDDLNGFDFVIRCLRKVFGYGRVKSFRLTMRAHFSGRAHVWSGTLEVAELKADQLRSCGADPAMAAAGATTLSVTIEPLQ